MFRKKKLRKVHQHQKPPHPIHHIKKKDSNGSYHTSLKGYFIWNQSYHHWKNSILSVSCC